MYFFTDLVLNPFWSNIMHNYDIEWRNQHNITAILVWLEISGCHHISGEMKLFLTETKYRRPRGPDWLAAAITCMGDPEVEHNRLASWLAGCAARYYGAPGPLHWPDRNCWLPIGLSWHSTRCKKDNTTTCWLGKQGLDFLYLHTAEHGYRFYFKQRFERRSLLQALVYVEKHYYYDQ